MDVRKYIVELIGTFFLVFTVGMTVIETPYGVIPAVAIGCALMVMVYAGGHISGGHYNPAVTLGVLIRGRCSILDSALYMISQSLGGIAAAFLAVYLKGEQGLATDDSMVSIEKWLIVEFLFTFALVFVVLNVATAKATAGNSYYGMAIGFTVVVGVFAAGSISGGSYNPAVALGLVVMGLLKTKFLWTHLVGDFVGGIVAGILFRALNPDDK